MADTTEPGLRLQQRLNELWQAMMNELPPESRAKCAWTWCGALLSQAVLIAAYMHGAEADLEAMRPALEDVAEALSQHFPTPRATIKEVPHA